MEPLGNTNDDNSSEEASSNSSLKTNHQTVSGFSLLIAATIALLYDLLVYRGHGHTGGGIFFASSAILYWIAIRQNSFQLHSGFLLLLTFILSLRMVWEGLSIHYWIGIVLLTALCLTRNGFLPTLANVVMYLVQSFFAPLRTIERYSKSFANIENRLKPAFWLSVGLPLLAVFVFGGIFIAANPDLMQTTGKWFQLVGDSLSRFLEELDPIEALILFTVFWYSTGQILPLTEMLYSSTIRSEPATPASSPVQLFDPYRNTLIAVSLLFAIYLVFEFNTLWLRAFPKGFYYAGYAHQGAAWLTIALALATACLSLIFRSSTLIDPRLPQLKKLAWIWSIENVLLAIAVYNRLGIYIQFNGMTRMRVLGLFGISAVLIGFVLVVLKIKRHRSFAWLIHSQIWAATLLAYILSITPVDFLIHRYNSYQILNGHLAPAVQISEHPVSKGGWLSLIPLMHCDDPLIREAIRWKLLQLHESYQEANQSADVSENWTAF